jgi:hypothetical protein
MVQVCPPQVASKTGAIMAVGCDLNLDKPFEAHYKVTLPSGEIVTMSESELSAYNMKMTAERNAKIAEFNAKMNAAAQEFHKGMEQVQRDIERINGEMRR